MLKHRLQLWIEQNPVFQNMGRNNRAQILSQSAVHVFKKNQTLFLQGHPAQNFQIVLSGKIKIFKDNSEGDQAIIHLAGANESLTISAIFADTILPYSAEAIEDSEIVSVPARLVRNLAQTDQALAGNLLAVMAEQSQIYLRQLEQLNLKSVSQRVGNFLLRELLRNKQRSQTLTLPHDKAVIAAYLGMQPESFSRALGQLRTQGIDIEKDHITLPNLFALCSHCDIGTAQKCSWHGTPDCPNPQCSE